MKKYKNERRGKNLFDEKEKSENRNRKKEKEKKKVHTCTFVSPRDHPPY